MSVNIFCDRGLPTRDASSGLVVNNICPAIFPICQTFVLKPKSCYESLADSCLCFGEIVRPANWSVQTVNSPESNEARAAKQNENITPGPAVFRATIPATRYIPVPTHDPTPSDVRSQAVKHFCKVRAFLRSVVAGTVIIRGKMRRICSEGYEGNISFSVAE